MLDHTLYVVGRCLIFVAKHYLVEVITLVAATIGLLCVFALYKQTVGEEAKRITWIQIISSDKGYRISKGLLRITREKNGPDELKLFLDFVRSPDVKEKKLSFNIITDGPMVSPDVNESDVWVDGEGKQHRPYAITTDEDEVHLVQTLTGTFFDVFQGQMLLNLRILVEQEPTPEIGAQFYTGGLLVTSVSPKPSSQLPEGGKPNAIIFDDALSKRPNFYDIAMVGADIEKQRTIQGNSFSFGIFAGVFTSLFAGAIVEILRTALKLREATRQRVKRRHSRQSTR
jgi:hypothetical protein